MSLSTRKPAKKRGFTLLELIVVIVVLGVLAAIAIPTFARVIQNSQDAATKATLSAMMKDAQALVAFQDGTTWDEAMAIAAEETATALSPGLSAAGRYTPKKSTVDEPVLNQTVVYTESAGKVVSSLRSPSGRICVGAISATSYTAPSCFPGNASSENGSGNTVSDVASGSLALPGFESTGSTDSTGSTSTTVVQGAAALSAGTYHSCTAFTGELACWGSNGAGQLGRTGDFTKAITLPGLTATVTASAASFYHTCAVQAGALYCWGRGTDGQLGNGSTTSSSTPVAVTGMSSGVTAVATGDKHTCAIKEAALYCWGTSAHGALGAGTSLTSSTTPHAITSLSSGVTAVSAASASTCAIQSEAAKCWGYNGSGQVGDGTYTNAFVPVQVSGLTSSVASLSTSGASACAAHNGAAKCWGGNYYGQLGDGTTTTQPTPVQVYGITAGTTAISVGDTHACAIQAGAAKCWGYNDAGQLGNGTTPSGTRSTAQQVTGLTSNVTSLDAGAYHVCAVRAEIPYCWGSNNQAQLGIGVSGGTYSSPQSVVRG